MPEEKDLVERLKDLVNELPLSIAQPIVEAQAEIGSLRQLVQDQSEALEAERKGSERDTREIEELTEENESLRISLHLRELEVARLEGYRERVNEFDPVPELREYEDQLTLPAAARQARHHDGAGMVMASANHRTSHWFNRGRRI